MKRDNNFVPESTAQISCLLKGTVIGDAAVELSKNRLFPVETTTLMALSIASYACSIGFSVQYEDGDKLPIGMYAIAEQPSGAGKSGTLKKLDRGFREAIMEENIRREKIRKQIMRSKSDKAGDLEEFEEQELLDNHNITPPVTNTTPEALDKELVRQFGWFCVTSTEQGLLDTLVGGKYSEGKGSFDLMLKGFNAEDHNEMRVTRQGFNGLPHGGAMCISQDGSVSTVLESSGSTGLIERFLILIEETNKGRRDRRNARNPKWGNVNHFNNQCKQIASDGLRDSKRLLFSNLKPIKLSSEAWDLLYGLQDDVEPDLGPGGRYHAHIFSSMWSKLDIQVMKVAATLWLMEGKSHQQEIDVDTVKVAATVVIAIFKGVVKVCEMKGIVGKSAEEEAVEEYMSKNGRMGKSEREILNAIRHKKIFAQYGNQCTNMAKEALNALIEKGILQLVVTGKVTKIRYAG